MPVYGIYTVKQMKKKPVSRQREWQIRNRDKMRAHHAVGYALRTGKLRPPDACEKCGRPANEQRLEAHHYLGYAEENHLDVEWLCQTCHRHKPKTHLPPSNLPPMDRTELASKGGLNAWKDIPAAQRSRIMSERQKKRWARVKAEAEEQT